MAPTMQTKNTSIEEFDDFEVVGSLETKPLKTLSVDQSTQKETHLDTLVAQLTTMVAEYQEGNTSSIENLHNALSSLTKKVHTRSATNDRRIRTLESCFDDCETSITDNATAVGKLDKKIGSETANLTAALDALGENVASTELRSKDNATRLDRMVIKYLPSVEAKLQNVKETQNKQAKEVDTKFDDFKRTMEGITPSEVMDIRRIAAEANIRSRMIEKALPSLKTDVLMTVAAEMDDIEGDNLRANKAADERFIASQNKIAERFHKMDDTINRSELVVQHIAGRVAPLLQDSIQEHDEVISKVVSDVARAENLAEEREIKYMEHIQRLSEDIKGVHVVLAQFQFYNMSLQLKVDQLQGNNIPTAPPMKKASAESEVAVPEYSLGNSIRAEIMKREIHAELTKRHRNKILSENALNTTVLRGEIMRRSILKEISARNQRRQVRAVKAELMRRSIIEEMKKRNQRRQVRAIKAELMRRSIVDEMKKRGLRRQVKAVKAEILRRSLLDEMKKRGIRRQVKAVKAEILRRNLVSEIEFRSQRPQIKKQMVSTAQLHSEIFKRSLRAEITRRAVFTPTATTTITESPLISLDDAPVKPPRVSALTLNLKTLLGEGVTVQVPPFVSVRYLKQLVYFKTGCNMHPSSQNLVYAGRVLKDTWRVGGGMFTAPVDSSSSADIDVTEEEFTGIKDNATVLIVVKKPFLV